ncbi:MAG: glycosyltransferase family 9 protein [Ignavibacteria bacterium]|nr:glycosyltransferase family 9 protein [Candidatus Gracilibacteria bacterium]
MKTSDTPFGKVKNILIVRQHHQLGDMLCALPMFAAIRKKFPHAHVTLIASPVSYEVLNSKANPYINQVINYNKQSVHSLLDFFNQLFSRKYDVGIVPSTASISRTSHYINFISGAKVRVGAESVENKINKSANLLTVKKKFFWDEQKLHQTERNLDVVRLIGCDLSLEEKKNVRIFLDKKEESYAERYFENNFPDKSKPVFAFHAGAAKVQNRWNKDNFVKLILMLHKKYNPYIVFTSGLIDGEINSYIRHKLKNHSVDSEIMYKIQIRKVASILRRVTLYLSNDTGPMHVAAYVNARVIGLFGPTKGYEWGPINPQGTFIQSDTENIDDIPSDTVYNFINNYLNKQ